MAPFYVLLFFISITIMLNLVSINCQGLRSATRRSAAFSRFNFLRYDILFLQETHWTDEIFDDIQREWGGKIVMSSGDNLSRGVAILFRPHLDFDITADSTDNEGRIVSCTITIDDETLQLINVYAPNNDTARKTLFTSLESFFSSHNIILGGDFNCVMNAQLDKRGGDPLPRPYATAKLKQILTRYNLTDVWRFQHPTMQAFTWSGKHPTTNAPILTRIDKFYISYDLTKNTTKSDIKPFPHSDHDLILLTLDLSQIKRGPGYWHFNNTLLQNALFTSDITAFWANWLSKKHNYTNLLAWWDKAKYHFKQIAIHHAKLQRKQENQERARLEQKINRLQQRTSGNATTDTIPYLKAKEELKQFELRQIERLKIRTKARFIEEGEKSTKYFYNLEKKRQADQTIRVLTKDNLDTVTNITDILQETRQFYKKLYAAEPIDLEAQQEILDIPSPRLSPTDQQSCEGLITLAELTSAIDNIEPNKSPGIDGLTANFYKHFWDILAPELTAVYNFAFSHGLLSVSQRRGIIILLFKKGDRTRLTQWRPISLLTTDYKILTKALATRLTKVLDKVIHTDQTASVPSRTINDNVCLLRDVIAFANETNKPLAVISIDQLKAFDRVSHTFLFNTLAKFGFGPQFIQWIKVLYNQTTSSVKCNGWLTAFISLERGLRQGCPLSAPLYILTAEILALHIRANPNIHGFKSPDSQHETKLSQYADDTTFLLSDDMSIHTAFEVLNSYERASGAKVNQSKCKGLWSGAFRNRTDQLYNFDWYNDYIPEKILGLFFGNIDCTLHNIRPRIAKITNTINAWAHRDLTFKGKALVINGLLTSVLWYYATAISVPSWAVRDIEQAVYGFFWSGKMPLVNRATLSLPRTEGGFNIHRISTKITALRLSTMRRLLSPEPAAWKSFICHYFRVAGINLGYNALTLRFNTQHIDPNIPSYHKELLKSWLAINPHLTRSSYPDNFHAILAEPLFLNPLITHNGQPLHFHHWVRSGVTHIKDVCYEVIPGLLPATAITELLTDATLSRTTTELETIITALPTDWITTINTPCPSQQVSPTSPPTFSIPASSPPNTRISLATIPTRRFYSLLVSNQNISIPALQYWERILLPPHRFNITFWKSLYCPLLPNKYGDFNWKIVHRVLPTAYSLHKINVYPTMTCHNCTATETLDHLLLHCPTLVPFWRQIQTYIDKLTNPPITLTDSTKLFGLPITNKDNERPTKLLVNFILTLAKFSIHKSATEHRLHQNTVPPAALFSSIVQAHIKWEYKRAQAQGTVYEFPFTWAINRALVSIENNCLIFHPWVFLFTSCQPRMYLRCNIYYPRPSVPYKSKELCKEPWYQTV